MKYLRTYGLCYLLGGLLAFGLKWYYSQAGSEELLWILAPTVGWVRVFSGISFTYVPEVGYVNDVLRFIVTPSCSGVQFLIILILMLIYSFSHRMGTTKRGLIWSLYAVAGAYLYTIVINGIRITLSIYLPRILQRGGIVLDWEAQKQLHTIIGTSVYFIFLLLCYQLADLASRNIVCWLRIQQEKQKAKKYGLVPVFWYFLIVLGVPFLHRAWVGNGIGFAAYACRVGSICLIILGVRWCIQKLWRGSR